MDHERFLEIDRDTTHLWGIRRFFRAARVVWGAPTMAGLIVGAAVLLAPSLAFAAYGVWTGRVAPIVWGGLGVMAFFAGRTDMAISGGCFQILAILVSIPVAITTRSPIHLAGGVLGFLTYFFAGMFKSVTVFQMGHTIRESREAFDRLDRSGLLMFVLKENPNVEISVSTLDEMKT